MEDKVINEEAVETTATNEEVKEVAFPGAEEKPTVSAKEKLEQELKNAKDKSMAEPIIGYLLGRIAEDKSLVEDVEQEHKTWDKCFDYIYEKARKQSKGNHACVRDDVVFEWAEDYYRKDDKAEEEKKAKEKAERDKKDKERKKEEKEKQKKRIEGMEKRAAKKNATNNDCKPEMQPKVIAKSEEKAKPKKKDLDGQMSLFDMMGM